MLLEIPNGKNGKERGNAPASLFIFRSTVADDAINIRNANTRIVMDECLMRENRVSLNNRLKPAATITPNIYKVLKCNENLDIENKRKQVFRQQNTPLF